MNAHHEEGLEPSATTVHSRAALDFPSLSGCEQMVTEPTHIDGELFYLVLTDAHDLVEFRVNSPIGMLCWSNLFFTWCIDSRSI